MSESAILIVPACQYHLCLNLIEKKNRSFKKWTALDCRSYRIAQLNLAGSVECFIDWAYENYFNFLPPRSRF